MAEKSKPLIFKWRKEDSPPRDRYVCMDSGAINYCTQTSPDALDIYGPTNTSGTEIPGSVRLPIIAGKLPNGQTVDEFYKDQNLTSFRSFAMFSKEKEPETIAVRVENIRTLIGEEDGGMIKFQVIFDNLENSGAKMEKAEFERLARAVEASKQQQATRTWTKS
jgi:hypothetical protein